MQVIAIGEQHLASMSTSGRRPLPRPLLNQLTPQNLSSSPFPSLLSPLQLSHSQVFYLSKYIFAMSDFDPPSNPPPSIDSPLALI